MHRSFTPGTREKNLRAKVGTNTQQSDTLRLLGVRGEKDKYLGDLVWEAANTSEE